MNGSHESVIQHNDRNAMQTSVLKAVCAAFVDTQEPGFCNHLGNMDCLPDGPGSRECSSQEAADAHRSMCVDTFMGYKCGCNSGYMESVDAKGVVECIDINECKMSDPCGMSSGKRVACHNVPGTFWCAAAFVCPCMKRAMSAVLQTVIHPPTYFNLSAVITGAPMHLLLLVCATLCEACTGNHERQPSLTGMGPVCRHPVCLQV